MPKKESFYFIFNLFLKLFIKRNDSLLEKYLKVKLIIRGMIPFQVTNNLKNKLLQPKEQLFRRFSSIKSLFGYSELLYLYINLPKETFIFNINGMIPFQE